MADETKIVLPHEPVALSIMVMFEISHDDQTDLALWHEPVVVEVSDADELKDLVSLLRDELTSAIGVENTVYIQTADGTPLTPKEVFAWLPGKMDSVQKTFGLSTTA